MIILVVTGILGDNPSYNRRLFVLCQVCRRLGALAQLQPGVGQRGGEFVGDLVSGNSGKVWGHVLMGIKTLLICSKNLAIF